MSSFSNAPAWSIAKRSKSTNLKNQHVVYPGPGNYDSNINIGKKPPGWKIGTSNRNKQQNGFGPGPGQYNAFSGKQGPKITMGIKPKSHGLQQNVPGPGNYHINDKAVSKVYSGYTMGAKYNGDKVQDLQPGPGSYQISSNKKSGVKIGTSTRGFGNQKGQIPGPGSYSFNTRPSSAGPQFSFGNGIKSGNSDSKYDSIPGPGQYDYDTIKSSQNMKGVTIGQRFNKNYNNISNLPGPGQYESTLKRPASGAKIGRAERTLLGSSYGPGPGAYDCSQSNNKKSAIKIGTGKRYNMQKSDTPGPGSYDNTLLGKKGGVTISGIKNKRTIEITPGPGAYDPVGDDARNRPYSAKIGKASRSKFDSSNTPGPGHYNLSTSQNWKFAYTKELRSNQNKTQQPGPGQYEIPLTVPSVPYYELSNPKFHDSGYFKL